MTLPTNVSGPLDGYASDENCYVVNPADFALILPKSSKVAGGNDGVILASDRWTLSSATNDFGAQGVASGMVVQLTGPASAFKAPEMLAVRSVSGHSVTLGRCGFAGSAGLPPAPAAGLTSVEFKVLTLYPQIEAAAFELDQQFAVDPAIVNRRPGDMTDERIFRRLTVLWVFLQLYTDENRSKDGDWSAKVKQYQDLYDSALASAVVRWGPLGTSQEPTTRFSTRLVR